MAVISRKIFSLMEGGQRNGWDDFQMLVRQRVVARRVPRLDGIMRSQVGPILRTNFRSFPANGTGAASPSGRSRKSTRNNKPSAVAAKLQW